jgi:general secretion pathway protein G
MPTSARGFTLIELLITLAIVALLALFTVPVAELVDGVEDAKDAKKGKLYFLRRIPRNPLDTSGAANAEDTWGKRAYASEPTAPQQGEDVYDVFVPSDAVGLNGVPYRQW